MSISLSSFAQRSNCDDNGGAQITVGSSCTFSTWDSANNTNYNASGTGCSAGDFDDVWGWFDATSTNTTITYSPDSDDAIITIFTGTCGSLTYVACANSGGSGVDETIVLPTTIGTRYRVRVQMNNSDSSMTGDICVYNSPISPQNDNCSNAIVLTVNSSCTYTTYTNQNATDSGETSPTCANYLGSDVWFTVTVPASGNVNIDTNISTPQEMTDSGMAVYSGSCGSLTQIACDDDSSANGAMSYLSILGRTAGEVLYIRVWEYGNNNNGAFGICAVDPGIICNAPNLTATTAITSSTATINWNPANPVPASGYEYIISTDNSTTTPGDDITGSTTGTSAPLTGLAQNTTYYIFVRSRCVSSTFSTWSSSSFTTLGPPPSNDDPCNAITLSVNTSCSFSTYTNANATASVGVPAPGCANYSGGDVWFSVTVPNSGNIIIDTDTGVITDSGMAVYSGTCGSLNLVECDDDGSANGLMSYIGLTGRTPGEILYVRVWEYGNNNNGTFDICAYTPTPPANDDCSNAISLSSDIVCNNISGTTSWATQSLAGCTGTADDDVWYSFLATNTEHTVTITDGSIYDIVLEVFSGNCGSLTSLGCTDNNISTGESTTLTGLTIGNTYFVRVYSLSSTQSNQGSFEICITNPIPPGTNGVTICTGDPSEYLTSDILCDGWIAGDDDSGPGLHPQITADLQTGVTYTLITTPFGGPNSGSYTWNVTGPGTTSLTNTINGTLNSSTDPQAFRPTIFIVSTDPCDFSTVNSNYTSVNFTVSVTGTYVFTMATNSIDLMGYIYIANTMTPGECSTTEWYTTQTGGTPIGFGSIFDPVGVSGSGLTDTNTPGTYTFWAGCSANSNPREQADYVIDGCGCKTWTAAAGNVDWFNGNNWSPSGAPTSTDCVVIPSASLDPEIGASDDANALDLTILNGGYLTIFAGGTLTVQNEVDVNAGGTLFLTGDPGAADGTSSSVSGSLIQVNNSSTNTGTITLQRQTFVRTQDYVYWSSPVQSFAIGGISTTPYKYKWNPTVSTNTGEHGTWVQTPSAETMSLGRGYIVRGPSGNGNTNTTATWNTITFSGVPNNGTILTEIRRGENYTATQPNPDPNSADISGNDDNWNLLGNPYPSALDADDFLTLNSQTNPRIVGTLWFWTHVTRIGQGNQNNPFYGTYTYNYDSEDYIEYNLTGANPDGFSGVIASGQGFFTLMDDSSLSGSTVEFNNSMRRASIESSAQFLRNGNIQNSENSFERHRIWIDFVNQETSKMSTVLLGYIEGATLEYDKLYDAISMPGSTTKIFMPSTTDEKNFVIQGRPLPFDENDRVPLSLVINEMGTYGLGVQQYDGLFDYDNQDVFVEDLELGITHNIKESPYYFTASTTGLIGNRFVITFIDNTLGIGSFDYINLNISAPGSKYIKVASGNDLINSVVVYDLLGRILIDHKDINAQELVINEIPKSGGTYIVKAVLLNGQEKIQKVVLK